MPRNRFGTVWEFNTKRFTVSLILEHDSRYIYDGEDEDGETQRMLDSGEFVAFNSEVRVELDGEEIASDFLGGSVYAPESVPDFYCAHRTSAREFRNTLAQKEQNISIGHYFPDMVRGAIRQARLEISNRARTLPKLRQKGV